MTYFTPVSGEASNMVQSEDFVMSASIRVPLMIMAVYFLSLWSGVAAVQAQTSPDVSLTCDQPAPIEVYPGALRSTIIYCTLTNPTTFSEKVDLTYQQGIISVAGPGSATVPPGDTSFQVAARADLRCDSVEWGSCYCSYFSNRSQGDDRVQAIQQTQGRS